MNSYIRCEITNHYAIAIILPNSSNKNEYIIFNNWTPNKININHFDLLINTEKW